MKAVLTRLVDEGVQTRGHMNFYEEEVKVFDCLTLELGWHDNEHQKSCIPIGEYNVEKHVSPKFGSCLRIVDVEDREGILIHPGNFNRDTHGCILVGRTFTDIDSDGYMDVVSSKITMNKIMSIVDESFKLLIIKA